MPTIESEALYLYELATEAEFQSMFPEGLSFKERVNWCLNEFRADMVAEAPAFAAAVLRRVAEMREAYKQATQAKATALAARLKANAAAGAACLLLLALTGCDNRSSEQQAGYTLAITTPAIQADHRMNVHPQYCDSVQADGYCVNFWQDGRPGRICGEYTVYPIR